jgi:membrane associated rhomboid family serine protease
MQDDRDLMSAPPRDFRAPATIALVAANIVAFVLQVTILPAPAYENMVLSLDGLRQGHLWQLITFQFLHGGTLYLTWMGVLHVTLNCWLLFVLGREVEWVLGEVRFLALYFCSGIVGGLFNVFAALVWPQYFGSAVVGASAGVCGLAAAFAMFYPETELTLLVLFVLPLNLKAKHLLWGILLLTCLGISFHNSWFGARIAHAAHLGGILTGLVFNAATSNTVLEARNREGPARP